MRAQRLIGSAFALACALLAAACAESPPQAIAARREFQQFQREVYPVLLRDCGFPACHGAPERFFRVWGPGRVRLPGEMTTPEAFDLPSTNELSASRALALSMIDEREPLSSPLLRKPLAVQAGGAGHLGADKYGRDVYRTPQDDGYLVIGRWVLSPPPPAPPGAAMPGATMPGAATP
jgi:hypothetical protein